MCEAKVPTPATFTFVIHDQSALDDYNARRFMINHNPDMVKVARNLMAFVLRHCQDQSPWHQPGSAEFGGTKFSWSFDVGAKSVQEPVDKN